MNTLIREQNSFFHERRRQPRKMTFKTGKLFYSDAGPSGVFCWIVDMAEFGVRVETSERIDVPEFFSMRFYNIECAVRRRWAFGHQMGLEFVVGEPHAPKPNN